MIPRFSGVCRSVLTGAFLLALACSQALGQEMGPGGSRTYVGVFGGAGGSSIDTITQNGIALFPEAAGGALYVNAVGSAHSRGVGLGGLHVGQQWSGWSLGTEGSGWGLLPAVELEGYYLGGRQRATLDNPGTRLPIHTFITTFPMDNGVFLTNAVFGLQTPGQALSPYFGVGIGTACLFVHGADSAQVIPPEAGVNHFDSDPSDSAWSFAVQLKAGFRVPLSENVYLFTEYRFLYVGSTNLVFGSTVAPGHAPTTNWIVHFGDRFSHLGVAGIGISF